MKSLKESLFDVDLSTKSPDMTMVNDFVAHFQEQSRLNYIDNIDTEKKTITISLPGDTLYIDPGKDDNIFYSFPPKDWKILNRSGKEYTKYVIQCRVKDIMNIPDCVTELSITGPIHDKYTQSELNDMLSSCNKAKKLSNLTINCPSLQNDLSNLSLKLKRLQVYASSHLGTDHSVKFNPNQDVNVLEIGYNISKLENLPAGIKQITAKCDGDELINILSNTNIGNNDLNKVLFKGRLISQQDVDTVKRNLSGGGESEEKKRFDKNAIEAQNRVVNKTDSTKDACGQDLHYGDLVLVFGDTVPKYDVYVKSMGKFCACKGLQVYPKNVIKIK